MGSKDKKVELLQTAIKRLIEEEEKDKLVKRSSSSSDGFIAVSSDAGDGDDHRLLSKLLSQLETLKDDGMLEEEEEEEEVKPSSEAARDSRSSQLASKEEIIGELKKLQRQNFITHCLLSAMIVLTVAWQLSEFSLVLRVKEGLSNPLKSLGSMIKGMVKRPRPAITAEEGEKLAPVKPNPLLTASSIRGLKIPELPHVELPAFHLEQDDDEE